MALADSVMEAIDRLVRYELWQRRQGHAMELFHEVVLRMRESGEGVGEGPKLEEALVARLPDGCEDPNWEQAAAIYGDSASAILAFLQWTAEDRDAARRLAALLLDEEAA